MWRKTSHIRVKEKWITRLMKNSSLFRISCPLSYMLMDGDDVIMTSAEETPCEFLFYWGISVRFVAKAWNLCSFEIKSFEIRCCVHSLRICLLLPGSSSHDEMQENSMSSCPSSDLNRSEDEFSADQASTSEFKLNLSPSRYADAYLQVSCFFV